LFFKIIQRAHKKAVVFEESTRNQRNLRRLFSSAGEPGFHQVLKNLIVA